MPLSPDHHPQTDSHKKHVAFKRLAIIAGFAILLILLFATTMVLRRRLLVEIANQDLVTHTRQVISELNQTESLLKDAETSQRGVLYTNDVKYLEPYNLAIGEVDQHINNLARLTADNPRQQARIPELRSLADAKLAELGQTISLHFSNRPDEAKALVLSDEGFVTMNKIHNLIAQMEQEETSLESSRTFALQRSIRVTLAFIYLAGFLRSVSLILLAYFILLEMNLREKHLHEIWRREEWFRVTVDSIGDAVICTDSQGNITLLNLVAERLTGWSQPEACGSPMDQMFQIVDPTTREVIANPMQEAVKLNRTGHLPPNCVLIHRDGHEIFIEDSASPIHNSEGEVTGSVIIFRDVTTARALTEQIRHASEHDALTGLPNRLLLNDRLGQAIALAKRHKDHIAVLFMDLDGFKHINDSLGHLVGDKLLQSVAGRLQQHVRTPDTVSRQGGDEFVLLLQEVRGPEDVAVTARRVLKAVSQAHSIDQHDLFVTASIGVSIYPEDGLDADALMKNADTAMYQAKEYGRQCYKFFKPAMNIQAVERQSIEEDLRYALERNEFTLYYQPKIDIGTGIITGVEALIRWMHPTRGCVPPLKFIRIAEESGLILPIGAWVLREACAQARAWIDQGLPFTTMAVNVSAVQFREEHFLEGIFAALAETGLDPVSLELELTESVLMQQPELAASILKKLRDKGVTVSVDDFGTGYSSLSYLKKLPLDTLKIDQSFIHNLSENPDDAAIAIAIISMGQSLNLRVIAEGVESVEDLGFLKAHGCDEAQGFYFSHPVPPREFALLLAQRPFHPTLYLM
ncbi:MAG: EAL domain-containing protein [Terracidiphilus sp.]|jgi:diguanylate cyclase (GGDEF)-like protein/PAS domain S-box-containing protein